MVRGMRTYSRCIVLVSLACLAFSAAPAQEKETKKPTETPAESEEDRVGWLYVEASAWVGQPDGTSFTAATRLDPADPFGATAMNVVPERHESGRYRAGYIVSKNVGEFLVTWFTHKVEDTISASEPGHFVFGEVPVYPLYAGVFDDGTADAFEAGASLKLRDLRVDFSRIGYQSPRVALRWTVGYRKVTHSRQQEGTYRALYPIYQGQPVVFPMFPQAPIPADILPFPDTMVQKSTFNGDGLEIGFDLNFPMGKKVTIETGVIAALLRGNVKTDYESTEHYYVITAPSDPNTILGVLAPPFSEFEQRDPDGSWTVARVRQLSTSTGVQTSEALSSDVLETYMGVRWHAWRGLDAFLGYRATRYGNIAAEARPIAATLNANGIVNSQGFQKVDKSALYNGLYGGVSYKF